MTAAFPLIQERTDPDRFDEVLQKFGLLDLSPAEVAEVHEALASMLADTDLPEPPPGSCPRCRKEDRLSAADELYPDQAGKSVCLRCDRVFDPTRSFYVGVE